MKKLIIVYILLFSILSSCKIDRVYYFLGNDYNLLELTDVSENWDHIVLKETKKGYQPIILPEIVRYNFNKEIIIIEQKYDSLKIASLLKKVASNENGYFNLNDELPFLDRESLKLIRSDLGEDTENVILSVISKDKYLNKLKNNDYNYYLFIKDADLIEGPLNKEDFYHVLKVREYDLDFE